MNDKLYTTRKGTLYKQIQTPRGRLLAMARPLRQRRLWDNVLPSKEQTSTQSGLVFNKWSNWKRFLYRPYLSQSFLCESRTLTQSNTTAKYFRKQQKRGGDKQGKNTLQKWTSVRQTMGRAEILFHLPQRENEAFTEKMGRKSTTFWGLSNFLSYE
jgi:hypothetical protein